MFLRVVNDVGNGDLTIEMSNAVHTAVSAYTGYKPKHKHCYYHLFRQTDETKK